jgi:cytochrome c oxidase assembly protein subunit 15
MVIVGGITRLTDSGLSMVNWSLFMGSIPPLNEAEWKEIFELYKQSPEFKKINFNYTLEDFKFIFFWEYLHRMIGRLLGLVFIIPFFYFLIKKRLTKKQKLQSMLLFFLGSIQAFFGWWMVKSGLVDNPNVSHYRLAVHLTTAFITCGYLLWVLLPLILPSSKNANKLIFKKLKLLAFLSIIQIVYGAFIAGLKAGRIYNTWPKMGDQWIPESVYSMSPFWTNFIEGLAGIQFVHRTLAIILLLLTIHIFVDSKKHKLSLIQKRAISLLLVVVLIQMVFGILTLVMGTPLYLSLTHQLLAFMLLMTLILNLYLFKSNFSTVYQLQK